MNTTSPAAPCTRILLASLMPEPSSAAANTTAVPSNIQDDHRGAMLFVVATVCVYGLSIVAFIAGHLQKGQMNKDEENQISQYLKRLHTSEPCTTDRNFHVTRFKSNLLASSALGQRHNRRISMMNKQSVSLPPGVGMSRRSALGSGWNDRETAFNGDHHREHSGRALLNKDFVQIVCEQPLFPHSSLSGVGHPGGTYAPRRQRRSGVTGITEQQSGDLDLDGQGGGPVGCWRRTAAAGHTERPLVHKSALPDIEEDEQSSHSEVSATSQLSSGSQRKTSSNSQSSSVRQDLAASLPTDERRDSSNSQSSSVNQDLSDSLPPNGRRASSSSQWHDATQASLDSPSANEPMDLFDAPPTDQTQSSFYLSEEADDDDKDDDESDENREFLPGETDIETRRESWQIYPKI